MIVTNIFDSNETRNEVEETLKLIKQTLIKTLGPYGSTTIIQDRMKNHYITKDGYTVLTNLDIRNDLGKVILDLIKKISRDLVRTVGDGSTSSIIISVELFFKLSEFLNQWNIPSKDLINLLNLLSSELIKDIELNSIPISDDLSELKTIATIALNNDETAGELIYNAYKEIGKYGFISIESGGLEDTYKISQGITVKRGMIDYRLSNNAKMDKCEFLEPLVFMVNDKLTSSDIPILSSVITESLSLKKPLVIVAKDYDLDVKNFLLINKQRQKENFEVVAIDYPLVSSYNLECFEDLACVLGCKIWDKMDGMELIDDGRLISVLGKCKKVLITEHDSQFIEGNGKKNKIKERYDELFKEYETDSKELDITETWLHQTRKRLANLSNGMAVLYIGGGSDVEIETKKFLVEDAIYACQSALENGYNIGGNLITLNLISKNNNKYASLVENYFLNKAYKDKDISKITTDFLDIIYQSFESSFKAVLENAKILNSVNIIDECVHKGNTIYNLKTYKYEGIDETKVINSSETDKEIIKASFSIIGLLVTSNQFIGMNFNTGVVV